MCGESITCDVCYLWGSLCGISGGCLWGISDCGGYRISVGGGEKVGRTRVRSKGRRKDTERGMKVQRVVYGDISRVVSVVCGGVGVREKNEVRDGARSEERGARREERGERREERGERRREVSVCCQIWVTRLFLTWDPTPLLAQLVYADLSLYYNSYSILYYTARCCTAPCCTVWK
jgi:hypothetical protein